MTRWMAVPVFVVILGAWVAWQSGFENSQAVLAYTLVSLTTLLIWRHSTYRLLPTRWTTALKLLEPNLEKQWNWLAKRVLIVSGAILIVASIMILVGVLRLDVNVVGLGGTIMVVHQLLRVGILNVLIRRLLDQQADRS